MLDTSVKFYHNKMFGAPALRGNPGSLAAVLEFALNTGSSDIAVTSITVSSGIATVQTAVDHKAISKQVILLKNSSSILLNREFKISSVVDARTFIIKVQGVQDGVYSNLVMSFPGAGFDKIKVGNKIAFRSQNPLSTKHWCQINDSESVVSEMSGFESLTDIDSGTVQFSPDLKYLFKQGNNKYDLGWVVISDGQTVYIGTEQLPAINTGLPYSFGYCLGGFGDIISYRDQDKYHFFVRGITSVHYTTGNNFPNYPESGQLSLCTSQDISNPYPIPLQLARSYNEIALNVRCTTYAMQFGDGGSSKHYSGSSYSVIPFPDALGNVHFANIYLYEQVTKKPRGKLPGLKFCLNAVGSQLHTYGDELVFINNIDNDIERTYLGLKWKDGVQFVDITGPWR